MVGQRVESHNPGKDDTRHTNSCYFTMAAKDDEGNLKEVPGLLLQNRQELVRFCEGKIIRDLSRHKRKSLAGDFQDQSNEQLRAACLGERCRVSSESSGNT